VLANHLFLRLALLRTPHAGERSPATTHSRSAQQLGQGDASGLTINLPLKAGAVRMGGGDASITLSPVLPLMR
jgi:hypothetical protein